MPITEGSTEKVLIRCIQCGAPIHFPEGDNSVKCPFCGMVILITSPHRVLKYYLNTTLDANSVKFIVEGECKRSRRGLPGSFQEPHLYYLPFWRFRGWYYWLQAEAEYYEFEDGAKLETESKITANSHPFDINFPGADIYSFRDVFLGIRSQTVELCPDMPEHLAGIAKVIKPEIPLEQARQMAYERTDSANKSKPAFLNELIGEKLTLIYLPLWVSGYYCKSRKYYSLIDGVAKREICRKEGDFEGVTENGGFDSIGSQKTIAHHCPECGADLPAGGNAVVFQCANCGRGWHLEENGLTQRDLLFGEPAGVTGTRYYPFWRFEAVFSDEDTILTYQEAKAIFANSLSLFIDDSSDSVFKFYTPAFPMRNPHGAWKLAADLTRAQPDFNFLQSEMVETDACSLPEGEAGELARVLWFYLILSSPGYKLRGSHNQPEMPEINFRPGQVVYLPLKEDGIFLREPTTGSGIQKKGVF